jgi:hypothetical protein
MRDHGGPRHHYGRPRERRGTRDAIGSAVADPPRRSPWSDRPDISGLLLFGADVDTFLHSRIFWLKMGLMATLVLNGVLLLHGQRRVQRGDANGWTRLHRTAVASLVLWFLTTLAGAALPNIG